MKRPLLFLGIFSAITLLPRSANAQWVQTNGPEGGNVNAIAVNNNDIFVSIAGGGGVFHSNNNGTSWTPMNTGLTYPNLWCLGVMDSLIVAGSYRGAFLYNSQTNWAMIDTNILKRVHSVAIKGSDIFVGALGGVYRSTDSGVTWSLANSGLSDTLIYSLTVSGNNMFAGTLSYGIFISNDNGANWSATNSGLYYYDQYYDSLWHRHYHAVATLAANDSTIFAGLSEGVYRSKDSGKSWTAINSGLLDSNYVECISASNNIIFAGTSSGGSNTNLYRSLDNGTSWSSIDLGIPPTAPPITGGFSVNALAISDTNVFAGTSGLREAGVYRSTDSGMSWIPINSGLTGVSVECLLVYSDKIFAGTYGWGIFRSIDSGMSWTATNSGLTCSGCLVVTSLVSKGSSLFAGTLGGGVCRSTDSGANWARISQTSPIDSLAFIHTLAVNGTSIFAGTDGYGIFRSNDNGASWSAVNFGLTSSSVWVIATDSNDILIGTSGGVFRSTDNGDQWINICFTGERVFALMVNGNDIFAGVNQNGIFLSNDNGTNWTKVMTTLSVNTLKVIDNYILASTYEGVYISSINGTNWNTFNSGFFNHHPEANSFAVFGNNVFAGIRGASVWRRSLTDFISEVKYPKNQTEHFFSQHITYHRSNTSIKISFSLPRSEQVKLNVYNLSGHLITTLCDKPMTAGPHRVAWDTRNIAAGCYLIRLQAGARSAVKSIPMFR